jgi:hypothetical protein
MRKTLGVCLLVLLLTGSASAGIIGNDAPAPPPSQPATVAQEPTTDGIMPNGAPDGDMDNGAAATFLQVVLNLLALS